MSLAFWGVLKGEMIEVVKMIGMKTEMKKRYLKK
jgi:hypothetical protein